MKTFILSVFLLLSLAAAVFAQNEYETGKNEFTVWGGFSPDSSTLIKGTGRVEDARFGVVAFRYARRFNNSDKVNLKYTADVIPIAFLNYPDFVILPTNPLTIGTERPTRYGFGASPLGIQANFRPRKKVQPFIEATGGLLYLNKRTPNYVGTRFQFTADVGGGVEFKLKEKRAFIIGYKYFHISNGNRGIQNPGFDNNLIYVGYTFFSK
ncbi:MAG: acyloxyacyl hydrolase [Pyrinomonadaceae bacterium]